jgi:hypothetical protein
VVKEQPGSYELCSNAACGYEPAESTANVLVRKYCYRKVTVPACPAGSVCLLPEDAEKTGVVPSGRVYTVCGAVAADGAASGTGYQKNLYCYEKQQSTGVCGAGSECMTEAQAKEKFGEFSTVSRAPCGYEFVRTAASTSTAATPKYTAVNTAAVEIPKYCIRPGSVSETPSVKPAVVAVTSGAVSTSQCRYDPEKKVCTGTCTNTAGCEVTGTAMNIRTGETVRVCGCTNNGCVFDYETGTCSGTCPANTGTCMVNTMVWDESGKIVYGECHCKKTPDQVPQVTATPYVISASSVAPVEVRSATAIPVENPRKVTGAADAAEQSAGATTQDGSPAGGTADTAPAQGSAVGAGKNTPAATDQPNATKPSADVIGSLGKLIRSFFGLG